MRTLPVDDAIEISDAIKILAKHKVTAEEYSELIKTLE